MIYFIQNEATQAIKIGFSDNPVKRLASLQTGSAEQLVMIATMPGGFTEERILHERFEEFRLFGEWFSSCNPNDTVLEFVAGINAVKKALEPLAKTSLAYPELCFLTSSAVGHMVSIYWAGLGPREEGAQYQAMKWDDSPGPGQDFWQWHQVHKPPFFDSPEFACVAYVASFREWHLKGQPS